MGRIKSEECEGKWIISNDPNVPPRWSQPTIIYKEMGGINNLPIFPLLLIIVALTVFIICVLEKYLH